MRDAEILEKLGDAAVSAATGANSEAIRKWKGRGIPWRHRFAVRALAKARRIKLPATFDRQRVA